VSTSLGAPTRGRSRRGLSDRQLAWAFLLPSALLLGTFELYPFLMVVRDSLYNIDVLANKEQFVGLTNFPAVLSDPVTQAAFSRSLEFIVGSVVLQTSMGLLTAMLLDQGLRGQLIWRGLNLVPYMVPAVVSTMIFRFSFNDVYGAFNYILVKSHLVSQTVPFLSDTHTIMLTVIVISSWRHTPFMTVVLLARLQTIPRELIEAAKVDGAGRMALFRYIFLPWLMPVLLIAMMLRTIWASVEFDFPYLTAFGGPLQASTVVPIQIYTLYTQQLDVGKASALALCLGVFMLMASVVYLWFYRRVERR
jgi:multiple sugar transport system permease protein